MNDPNGLVYYEGEYHLFYQYNPDSTVWGTMHWGHAISTDMIHWEELPIAIYPDSRGWIFSGSAVVDWKNTTGFGSTSNPPMVAIYTYHDMAGEKAGRKNIQSQGIAFSLDKGRTWTPYTQNPVLPNPDIQDFRDPKVSWIEQSNQWVMALAVQDHIEFYGSPDLKEWNKLSEFGKELGNHNGVWECPDLFPLTDSNGSTRWVLFVSIGNGGPQGGSATQYFIGNFNGTSFSSQDSVTRWIDYGADNYAGVTWSDIPKEDGRRLFIGWMSNWQYARLVPTKSWRSAMTLPREVVLINRKNNFALQFKPVEELNSILDEGKIYTRAAEYKLRGNTKLTLKDTAIQNFKLVLNNQKKSFIEIELSDNKLSFNRSFSGNVDFHEAFPQNHIVPLTFPVSQIDLFIDKSSIEIFINEGEMVLTELVFPLAPLSRARLEMKHPKFTVTPIRSPWRE
jgi:fructan beta-fructosidase